MCRTMRQVGLATPVLELSAKAFRREWLSIFRDQERLTTDRRRCDDLLQVRMERDIHVNGRTVLVLRLAILDSIVVDVRGSEAHGILAAAGCVEQQGHREP